MRDDPPHHGLADAAIPVGGKLWRALGPNGALVLGYAVLAAHVGLVVTCQLVAVMVPRDHLGIWERTLHDVPMHATVWLPMAGGSTVVIGELQRRGTIRRRSPGRGTLSRASNESVWRMISPSWSLAWAVLGGSACALLLLLMGHEPWAHVSGDLTWPPLFFNGIIVAGLAGAALGSWVKKLAWARRHGRVRNLVGVAPAASHPGSSEREPRAGSEQESHVAEPSAFWRWFSFRWRIDAWMCAFGAIGLFAGAALLQLLTRLPEDHQTAAPACIGMIVGGAALLVTGAFFTTQFWRAGEDLAAGESAT